MLRSWMCAQHHFLGILATGGQLLVLLHCSKVEIDGRRYGNRITFFSLVPRSQEKRSSSFLNVGEYSTFPRCCVKNSYIFSNYIKNEFNHFDFSFFCDVIFRRWIGLENWQNSFKHHVFPVLRVHKNDPMTLDLYVVDTVSIDIRANL